MDNPNNWKPIPGDEDYTINEIGVVKNKNGKVLSRFMRGDYPSVCLRNSEGKFVIRAVHELICLTFIGPRPMPEPGCEMITANHKDGNKLNSVKSNMEWSTNSENVIHAFKNRLNKSSVHVKATNIETGEVLNFFSLRALARWSKVPNVSGRALLVKYSGELYDNKWVLEETAPAIRSSGERTRKRIYVLDIARLLGLRSSDGEDKYEFDSGHEAAGKLGIDRKSIYRSIKKGIGKITAGFIISTEPILAAATDYSIEDVKSSLWWADFYSGKKT